MISSWKKNHKLHYLINQHMLMFHLMMTEHKRVVIYQ